MRRFSDWLHGEWERAVFGVAAAILILVVAWRFSQSGPRDEFRGGSGAAPVDEAMFPEQALAFLASSTLPVIEGGDRNPFRWMRQAPAAKPTPPRRPAPAPPSEASPAPAGTSVAPATPASAESTAPAVAARPTSVPGIMRFTYQGKDRTGRAVAIILLQRRGQSGLPATLTLGIGEEAEGIRVMGITEEAVLVRDARGRRLRANRQESTSVWVEGR
ncbi:MAG TPA: hypothetical protein PKY10_02620 [Lentisphaeria bacterium]|nr:hypothetical protein [Lentisphaeria bacterium]